MSQPSTYGPIPDGTAPDTSTSKGVGSPKESADAPAAAETAEKSAVSAAADTPADDTATQKSKHLELGAGTAFLIKMNKLKDE